LNKKGAAIAAPFLFNDLDNVNVFNATNPAFALTSQRHPSRWFPSMLGVPTATDLDSASRSVPSDVSQSRPVW
jgi:hypothetical protein